MSEPVLELRDIRRTYIQAGSNLEVLKGCSMTLNAGELVALIGPSGAGKSTFLHAAGLLEKPDGGSIRIKGREAAALDDGGRTELRRTSIGFVYQFHHLLPEFSALENIMVPQMIAGVAKSEAKTRAMGLLKDVGLAERADHRPARLSGGEQQRVALARALANNPAVLIADEPTGNLDPETAAHVFSILTNLVKTQNLALLVATHNHELAHRIGRVMELKNGLTLPV